MLSESVMLSFPWRREALSLLLGLAIPGTAVSGQTVVVRAGADVGAWVEPGAIVRVPLQVDLRVGSALGLASLEQRVSWGAGLRLDSIRPVPDAGLTLTANTTEALSARRLRYSAFSSEAWTGDTLSVAVLFFTAQDALGGGRVRLETLVAGNAEGASVLDAVQARGYPLCVAPRGDWGDVTGDGAVNVIDAQQVARSSVGLGVLRPDLVAQRGDVTNDGAVNVIDAQQIARFGVGLNAAARTGQPLWPVPTPAAMTVSPPDLYGREAFPWVQLEADVVDGSGASLTGCVEVTWASDAPAVAGVDADGLVTQMTNGPVTITAQVAEQPGGSARARRVFTLADNGVTVRCATADVGETGRIGDVAHTRQSEAELRALVAAGTYEALSTSCTSGVTNMVGLFNGKATFNADIRTWDVSSVTNMNDMFFDAASF